MTLYTRAGCSLCAEAERAVIRTFGARSVRLIDITGNSELEDLYVFRVPVLLVGQTALAEGRITARDARVSLTRLRHFAPDA